LHEDTALEVLRKLKGFENIEKAGMKLSIIFCGNFTENFVKDGYSIALLCHWLFQVYFCIVQELSVAAPMLSVINSLLKLNARSNIETQS
jgi:hypothetical protein